MYSNNIDCAMCGGTGETVVKMPKEFLQDFDGGDSIEWRDYQNPVKVNLCVDCRDISFKMAKDHDTSPLPEWDVTSVKKDMLLGKHTPTSRIIEDMVMLVQAEDKDYTMDHKVKNAKITIYVAAEHGYLKEK